MKQLIDVARVAEMARLALTDEERRTLQGQLEEILSYTQLLDALPLENVPPTIHGLEGVAAMRDDIEAPPYGHELLLATAPELHESEYRLPKIVEEA